MRKTLGKRSHGGVRIGHFKSTAESATQVLPTPQRVIIPMLQHIGAPCTPVVKMGDLVKVGQVIGDSDKPMSAPVHASVSGKVVAVGEIVMPNSVRLMAATIESDGEMQADESICPPNVNDKDSFIEAVRQSGLVGLGGAGFPTALKLNPRNLDEVDTLVINFAECEPYITSDYRESEENPQDIVDGILAAKKYLDIKNVYIGIEENKPKALEIMAQLIMDIDGVEAVKLRARYPQGAEKVLIYETCGRVVPMGKLPADVGVIVLNVASISFISRFLKTGMPLVRKRVTVDGGAVNRPGNVMVPIGTPIIDVINFCGGYKVSPRKLLMGGPMMGLALCDDSFPILKNNNAILALSRDEVMEDEPTACINCGRCVMACPMKLMPRDMERAYEAGDTALLTKLQVAGCMECGACTFACPAKRHLVLSFKLGKQLVRQAALSGGGK